MMNDINNKCKEGRFEDLFMIFGECLREENVTAIIVLCIKSIESIVFYGRIEDNQNRFLELL